jgi:hypothetical protein
MMYLLSASHAFQCDQLAQFVIEIMIIRYDIDAVIVAIVLVIISLEGHNLATVGSGD